jgi:hypothetical protein
MTNKRVMRIPNTTPSGHTGRNPLSDSEKGEALADSLEAQFQPVIAHSVPAVIEMVNVTLEKCF